MNSRAHARTNTDMEQIERIKQMEERLDAVSAAVEQLTAALDKYQQVADSLAELNAYYGSDLWKQDFAADEAGKLPHDLKRGVLSEDGLWNVLAENRILELRLSKLLDQLQEP